MFTEEDIQQGLPAKLQPFLKVTSSSFPRSEIQEMIEAFWEAARIIDGKAIIKSARHVVFGVNPFVITSESATTTIDLRADIPCAVFQSLVLYDLERISDLPYEAQVAAFLEELCHSLLDIADERLVKRTVTYLYDGVEFVDGRYGIRKRNRHK